MAGMREATDRSPPRGETTDAIYLPECNSLLESVQTPRASHCRGSSFSHGPSIAGAAETTTTTSASHPGVGKSPPPLSVRVFESRREPCAPAGSHRVLGRKSGSRKECDGGRHTLMDVCHSLDCPLCLPARPGINLLISQPWSSSCRREYSVNSRGKNVGAELQVRGTHRSVSCASLAASASRAERVGYLGEWARRSAGSADCSGPDAEQGLSTRERKQPQEPPSQRNSCG
ncbi:hypothetical protein AAFF_G00227710 [Aldrovandia affinis]|uniref:Uncharacterized protein n=1 Tax=Aldrovandia affinis TaxID=143900 RepID=A0AAD7X2M5_9TELE|nr:hypothetical protein AAFF_G00227710 [Aldrovandia affinis]